MEINWQNNPIRQITQVLEKLTTLLNTETQLLKDFHVLQIQDLQEEKMYLTNVLEVAQRKVGQNPAIIGSVAAKDKQAFEYMGQKFTIAMEENYLELTRAKEVNKKIVEMISLAATRHFSNSGGYGRNGKLGMSFAKNNQELPPITYSGSA